MEQEKALLNSRYALLKRTSSCAEVTSYLALDKKAGEEVIINEFFSESIMDRDNDGNIVVRSGREVLYKSLLSDYEELCNYVMGLPENAPVVRPSEFFTERGTGYAVYRGTDNETLEDHLARRGRVNWITVKKMMGPIVSLVGRLHADGVYHRGISPSTLYVDRDGRLLLGGFSIPAARTAGSEIASTLYFGYSAPEQYSSSSWQGSWTDVYSLAAVCYRMATGTTPVEWRQRTQGHGLTEPSSLTLGIPKYASDAIVKGLSVELSSRYRTPDEFWCALLAPSDGGTIRYAVDDIPKRSDVPDDEKKIPGKVIASWTAAGILIASAAIFGAMSISSHIADKYIKPAVDESSLLSETLSQSQQASSEPEKIPDFTGRDIETVLLNEEYQDMFSFDIVRVYSETEHPGTIVEQYPRTGAKYEKDMMVTLSVSKGTERAFMPEVVGKTLHTAKALLEQEEIAYRVVYSYDGGYSEGRVKAASIPEGGVVYRTTDVVELEVNGREEAETFDKNDTEE